MFLACDSKDEGTRIFRKVGKHPPKNTMSHYRRHRCENLKCRTWQLLTQNSTLSVSFRDETHVDKQAGPCQVAVSLCEFTQSNGDGFVASCNHSKELEVISRMCSVEGDGGWTKNIEIKSVELRTRTAVY